ncbi:hypothetical protein BKA56DRAFT_609967 [Ilyonectria sp. MPI-CAGE-AT-0026]|nr:hypothetical protein BKA56DRAFT_609967 [Ilyonectria sp. MPI-CAGE-AT-0026]
MAPLGAKKVLRCFGGVRLACSSCGCRVSQSYLRDTTTADEFGESTWLRRLVFRPSHTIPHNAGREDAAAVAVPGAASRWPSHGAILLGPLPHFMPPAGGNKGGDGDRRVITASDDSTARQLDNNVTMLLGPGCQSVKALVHLQSPDDVLTAAIAGCALSRQPATTTTDAPLCHL